MMHLLRKAEQNHEKRQSEWWTWQPKLEGGISQIQVRSFTTCSKIQFQLQRQRESTHQTVWQHTPDSVRAHTSLSCTFSNSSGHESCRISGSLSVTTQSDGTSQLDWPSSPIMVTVGNWRDSDVTMHRWAERSASVCKSSLPYKTKSIK